MMPRGEHSIGNELENEPRWPRDVFELAQQEITNAHSHPFPAAPPIINREELKKETRQYEDAREEARKEALEEARKEACKPLQMPQAEVTHANANPFETPPRALSPLRAPRAPRVPRAPRAPRASRALSPPRVLSPQPQEMEIEVMEMSENPPAQGEPRPFDPFVVQQTSNVFSGFPPADNNPFTPAIWQNFSLPGSYPLEDAVDRCVAHLVEMGYADGPEGVDQVERLKVYAQISDGDLDAAIEMLEEEKRAWEENS
jgi:hypothetical protein